MSITDNNEPIISPENVRAFRPSGLIGRLEGLRRELTEVDKRLGAFLDELKKAKELF